MIRKMGPMPPIFTPRGSSLLCSPDSCHGPSIGGEHRAGISLRYFHGTPEGFYILPSSSFFVLIPMWIFFGPPDKDLTLGFPLLISLIVQNLLDCRVEKEKRSVLCVAGGELAPGRSLLREPHRIHIISR